MRFDLSSDDIRNVIDFANGENDSFINSPKMSEFINLFYCCNKQIMELQRRTASANASLERRLQRYADKERRNMENGSAFTDFEEDNTILIAKGIVYLLGIYRVQVSNSKVLAIMYLLYAAWLESHHQRVIKDRPNRWIDNNGNDYGVVFWSLKKFFETPNWKVAGRNDYRELQKVAKGGVAKCLENVVRNNYRVVGLHKSISSTAPYVDAIQKREKVLSDYQIMLWQQQRKSGRE